MNILVIGATGNSGSQVVEHLQKKGFMPIAAVRNIEKARQRLGSGLQYLPFDYSRPETFEEALKGIDKLFFIAPPNAEDPAPLEALLEAAAKNRLRHLLFHSGRTTGDVEGAPLNTIEKRLAASGLPYTIIRPGWFMQNFISWIGFTISTDNAFYLPAGNSRSAFIDVRDIGAAAAEILTQDRHIGKTYELTSTEALDHYQVAALLSEASGRTISYVALSREGFIEKMVEKGWSRQAAEFTAKLYDLVNTGKEDVVSLDLQGILGRVPITFKQFAEDYANGF